MKNLLSFSIKKFKNNKNETKVVDMFGGSKSGVVCIKIYTSDEIILHGNVTNRYIYW